MKVRRLRSIQVKVFAIIFSLTTAIVLLLTTYFPHRQIAASRHALESKAVTYGKLTSHELEPAVAFDDHETAREVFEAMRSDSEVRALALYSSDGRLIQADGEVAVAPPGGLDRPLLQSSDDAVIAMTPVVAKEGPRGILVVELSTAALEVERVQTQRVGFLIGALALASGFVAAWIIGKSIAKRLRAVADAATTVASGDLSRPSLDASSADEIGQLSGAFNVMVSDIGRLMTQIEKTAAEEQTRLDALVKKRTSELDARNVDMARVLSNVAQGLVTLDRDGVMGVERSAALEAWLGPAPASGKFADYLATTSADTASFFELGWELILEDMMPLDICVGQLPRTLSAGKRSLAFDYRPILDGEKLDHLLVVVSDVTDQVERQRADVEQRDMLNAFERLRSDKRGFAEFFTDACELVEMLQAEGAGLDPVLRNRRLHTLKGNAATFGLNHAARLCHDLETLLTEQGGELSEAALQPLVAHWTALASKITLLLGDTKAAEVEVTPAEHAAAIRALVGGAPRSDVAARMASWTLERADRRLDRAADQARALARRLEKGEITVATDDGDVRLDAATWAPFWSAFTHVVRNAVDHGLETPEERREKGRPENGTITLRTYEDRNDTVVELADDGRGIDWERLRAVAKTANLPHATHEDLLDALFRDGVSTRETVDENSGRGVGMSAVRAACTALGGTVEVTSTPNQGTRFRFRVPRTPHSATHAGVRCNTFAPPALA